MTRGWSLLLSLSALGCVDVSGGAVEARWDLRDTSGVRIDCQRAAVSQLRFALEPTTGGADPCSAEARCSFPCERGVGTTPFIIPEGDYAMALEVVDGAGRVLDVRAGVTAPASVVRQVRTGRLTDLSVNLIIVNR